MGALTIARLAEAAGVGVETIRFYQRTGLMAQPPRPPQGIRRYTARDVARVRFIKAAQRLGFSLAEITQLLRLDDGTNCRDARRIAERKLTEVRGRLADLRRVEATLGKLVRRCTTASGKVSCPLIATLQHDDRR